MQPSDSSIANTTNVEKPPTTEHSSTKTTNFQAADSVGFTQTPPLYPTPITQPSSAPPLAHHHHHPSQASPNTPNVPYQVINIIGKGEWRI